jgi:hypothetical protein
MIFQALRKKYTNISPQTYLLVYSFIFYPGLYLSLVPYIFKQETILTVCIRNAFLSNMNKIN